MKNALECYYGDNLPFMNLAAEKVLNCIEAARMKKEEASGREAVEYVKSRIKSPESMRSKLKKKSCEANVLNSLTKVHDACGIRVVCTFINDVFDMVCTLKGSREFELLEEKDYVHDPKPNGYRSYHLILLVPVSIGEVSRKIFVEVQIRTIAMDCWATLEHQLKYKHEIPKQELFAEELRRCADEIASTDLNLQTLRDMIDREKKTERPGA
jgi:putative GTP pyrophosphokinase